VNYSSQVKQDRRYTCIVTLRSVRVTIYAVETKISVRYSECVCIPALVIQHSKRMRRIILSVQLYLIFPHYLTNGTILEKYYWKWNACFNFLYKLCL